MVAPRVGKNVAAVVKMAKKDEAILKPMQDIGVDTYLIPSAETTYSRVFHFSANVDERKLTLVKSAGFITSRRSPLDSPAFISRNFRRGFDMDLMKGHQGPRLYLSTDMQSFVPTSIPRTSRDRVLGRREQERDRGDDDKHNLDMSSADPDGTTTGESAKIVESWVCPETLITHSEGVLAP
jgi:hypothetical protein